MHSCIMMSGCTEEAAKGHNIHAVPLKLGYKEASMATVVLVITQVRIVRTNC